MLTHPGIRQMHSSHVIDKRAATNFTASTLPLRMFHTPCQDVLRHLHHQVDSVTRETQAADPDQVVVKQRFRAHLGPTPHVSITCQNEYTRIHLHLYMNGLIDYIYLLRNAFGCSAEIHYQPDV